MKLGFGQIAIDDFKSIPSLQFEFARSAGLYFIQGDNRLEPRLQSNGVGKSSLFDALAWCLFGKTVGGLRGPDVVPWGGGRPAVSLMLQCDGQAHRVLRQHNPNGLWLDQRPVEQETVDKLVGMNHVTLCHTLLLGQGRPLFFDLTPGQKLELFADVLDLQRWDKRSDNASMAARSLALHNAGAEGMLEHMQRELTGLKPQIADLKRQSNDWESAAQQRLRQVEAEIAVLEAQVLELEPLVDEADLAYDGAMTELDSLRSQISDLQRQHYDSEHTLRHLEQLASSRDRCPTCGQRISKSLADPAKIKEAKSIDADLRRRLELLRTTEDRFIRQRDASRAQLDLRKPALSVARTKLNLLRDQLTSEQHEGNPYRRQLGQLRQRRDDLNLSIVKHDKELQQQRRKQARLEFWIKGFKDLKLYIIEETLAELQLTANAMLEQVGLIGWSLQFAAERETKSGTLQRGLNVLVQSPHNTAAVKWESWSGGEGQRLRLIGALALGEVLLNRAGIEPQLELLDEPTTHLSPQGVHDLIDLLSERAVGLGRTVFYADQTAVASDRFAGVLTVERGNGGTRIIES